ncbi:hypothetical protein ACFV19_17355 [Streptomyces griseoluteus]|uniref:hypothetical protein n=1 Tax=Streptomyces griseoluteus TaxID=29306 RepID=UPI0036B85993
MLSEVPAARAGGSSGVPATIRRASFALGVAPLGALFLTRVPHLGRPAALLIALVTQLTAILATGLLSLRLPREAG